MSRRKVLVFVGCGNMGAAIISGGQKKMPDARIVAVDPDMGRAKRLLSGSDSVELVESIADISGTSPDLIILGVKPQAFGVLDEDVVRFLGSAPMVSIMAGIPLKTITQVTGNSQVVRVMPNLPALVGAGMSLGVVQDDNIDVKAIEAVEVLFSAVGKFHWAESEEIFERASPLFGCGPGFLFAIAEQFSKAGTELGLSQELSDSLVAQTMLGASIMLSNDTRSARELKEAVASPGGTTQAGLSVLEGSQALPLIIPATIQAAYERALQLASSKSG